MVEQESLTKEELIEVYEKHASDNGFRLQPDPVILDGILTGLLKKQELFGSRFCPCRRLSGVSVEDEKIVCPCVYHKDEIKEDGHCKCLLFVK